jgi:hypothetical protein
MKNLAIFIAVFAIPSTTLAAPSVGSVSGTVSDGQTITISGSGFGVKSPAAPWLYDSFENYSPGTGMDGKSPQIGTTTYERYDYEGVQGVYATDRAYSGSQAAKTVNSTDTSVTSDHFAFRGQATQKRFISYRRWRTGAEGVYKGDRQTANLGNGNDNPFYDSPPNFGRDGYLFTNNGSTFDDHGYIEDEVDNAWQRIDQWLTISTPDVANGRYEYYIDNVLQASTGNYATCSSAETNGCQIDSWISPNYINKSTTLTFWIDDLYVDNTQARVELCAGSSWASRGNCNIQIPSAWSSTSVTATSNAANFNSEQTTYIYIVDDTGATNSNGYAVTIGSDSEPPAQAAGGRLSGSLSGGGVMR